LYARFTNSNYRKELRKNQIIFLNLTTLLGFGDISKNLVNVSWSFPCLLLQRGEEENGTKTGPPLSIVSGEEWIFDDDFSQDSKRDH
jgi:hypothetical protein